MKTSIHRQSRRNFLKSGGAALIGSVTLLSNRNLLAATHLDLPLGIQLYSVRDLLPKDYEGTLQQIASLGYREVEAAGFYQHTAPEVKAALRNTGLRCVSSHYSYNDLN